MSSLKGKTLFITGASRGIGLAIAVRAAQDGANVAIAAKTSDPHPKLPGTVFAAAEAVEQAGGKALPLVVDIREEDQVVDAVNKTVATFGGIDILVNNASAISFTNTMITGMKKYDLMNQVNARGTYMCSHYCLPHLLKAPNPHILNMSPPLNMETRWFENSTAYSIAKYGMSMCVLGMAGEFKGKVAVNALWPRTAIATSAMKLLGGGDEKVFAQCRKPEILSDCAHIILTRDAKDPKNSGNFFIDDELLLSTGVTDLEHYSCVPGAKLLPDFFV